MVLFPRSNTKTSFTSLSEVGKLKFHKEIHLKQSLKVSIRLVTLLNRHSCCQAANLLQGTKCGRTDSTHCPLPSTQSHTQVNRDKEGKGGQCSVVNSHKHPSTHIRSYITPIAACCPNSVLFSSSSSSESHDCAYFQTFSSLVFLTVLITVLLKTIPMTH